MTASKKHTFLVRLREFYRITLGDHVDVLVTAHHILGGTLVVQDLVIFRVKVSFDLRAIFRGN